MTSQIVTPIDPFAAHVHGGYSDALVEVHAVGPQLPRRELRTVRTTHFDVARVAGRIRVRHSLAASQIDDDLGGLLADELFGPGWLRGPDLFERLFTGVVRSVADDPREAWGHFYRNSLLRIEECLTTATIGSGSHGTISGYAPVYQHAESLLVDGSSLELGCCFGFLSLRIAAAGRRVMSSDVSAGTVRLLATMAPLLGVELSTVPADAARFPAVADYADNVLVIHLLEHLDQAHGARVLTEALRLARRRVVVAVPLEREADETWGHVRPVSLDDLDAWGRSTGLAYDVHEHHGGWLVIESR
ncbi:MAG: mycofactocin oligosaccharide methyltransferase MftM [Marmoricola sp.]